MCSDTGKGFFYPYILTLFYGKDIHDLEDQKEQLIVSPAEKAPKSLMQNALQLGFCACGLYVSNFFKDFTINNKLLLVIPVCVTFYRMNSFLKKSMFFFKKMIIYFEKSYCG